MALPQPTGINLYQPGCTYTCNNGGSCVEGICSCPFGYSGLTCEDDVTIMNIVIGLISGLCFCIICIIVFTIYQRLQEPQSPLNHVRSIPRRTWSTNDRRRALTDLEAPPNYEEAAKLACEDGCSCQSGSITTVNRQSTLVSLNESTVCSVPKTSVRITKSSTKIKPATLRPMSFTARLRERALSIGRRHHLPDVTIEIDSAPRRSLSESSKQMGRSSRPMSSKVDKQKKRVKGPNRASSVPGKIVQVTVTEESE